MYNQRDYPNLPYPSPALRGATVASGGCGPVAMSMIVENLTGKAFPPEESAPFALSCGARVIGGTDMKKLGAATAAKFGLAFRTTSDIAELIAALRAGGMAILNVGGDRAGYQGVFSDAGHYIAAIGEIGGIVQLLDPSLYEGKYNAAHRRRVTVQGKMLYAEKDVIAKDAENREPRYYLFGKRQEIFPEN